MPHLLRIDSSIQGDGSVSRKLTARAVGVWKAAHPTGTITYRDLGNAPLPHFGPSAQLARVVPRDQQNGAQVAAWALSEELINEVKEADAIIMGLPLYNYGPPSGVKAWVDHSSTPGCPTTRWRTRACSVGVSSSCSTPAVADTPKAPRATAGTT